MKVTDNFLSLQPYKPGKPISETKRELGLKEVIKLASNESPLGPSQAVLEAIRANAGEVYRYPDGACFEMRRALMEYFGVEGNQLIFGNGSDELVDILCQIYLEPGDSVLTSQGAFSAYQISAQSVRAKTIHTSLTTDSRFDLAAMAEQLQNNAKIKLVFLPNPNNPTGTYFTEKEFEDFMAVAGSKDVYVVLDEAYVEFVRATDYPSGQGFQRRFKNILLLRTMSKVFGLAGLRVGILIAPPDVIDLMNRVRKPFNINLLAQVAVAAAVKDRAHIEIVKRLTWEGLDYYYSALKDMGLKYLPSQGNFVLFDTGRNGEDVYQAMLKQGVILRPVTSYGFPKHLRMSVGLPDENRAAIAALKKVLSQN